MTVAPAHGALRIAHVAHAFPPSSRAGAENYAEALALEQSRRHEVCVFHRVDHPQLPEYHVEEGEHRGLAVRRLNRTFSDLRHFRDTYRSDGVEQRFAEFLDDWRPDLVHFHHVTCLSTTCVQAAYARRIPVVYTLHDFWLLCPRGQLLRRDLSLCRRNEDADCVRCMAHQLDIRGGHARARALLRRSETWSRLRLPREWARRLATRPYRRQPQALAEIRERTRHVLEIARLVARFVAPTGFLRDRYVRFGFDSHRIQVEDYGFDLRPWLGMKRRPRAVDAPLRLAYLGTWIPSKGVDVLLRAVREIDPARVRLDVHGHAVPYDGVPDYERQLRQLAAGAPHIRLGDRYTPEQIPSLLAEADVLVVPSIWYENSPLTVHEAWLAGIPVLASDHGGTRELIELHGGGWLFPAGDAVRLRQRIEGLCDAPEALERMSISAAGVVAIEDHAERIQSLYHDALSHRSRG